MNAAYKLRRLQRLADAQAGGCYWCARMAILPDDPGYYRNASRTKISGKAATVDHLYSRRHPLRHTKHQRLVMACDTCNRRRGEVEMFHWSVAGALQRRVYLPTEKIPSRLERARWSEQEFDAWKAGVANAVVTA